VIPRLLASVTADGVRSFLRGRGMTLSAVLVVALTFTVSALAFHAAENLSAAVARFGRPDVLRVYFQEETSAAAMIRLTARLRTRAGVERVDRIAPETARARFREQFPEMADLEELLGENPFPPHLEVVLPGDAPPDLRLSLKRELQEEAAVQAVLSDDLWSERLLRLAALIRRVGEGTGLVFALVAALVVSGVIRISLAARRDEIQVMWVVGSSRTFIAGPFVVEGVLLGAAGALLAVAVTWGIFRLALIMAPAHPLLGFMALTPLPLPAAAFLVVAAGVAGAGGAALAVGRALARP
jgi:cell division transport system permease protein